MSETKRAFGSSLCREEDKEWLETAILTIAQKCFDQVTDTEEMLFSSIPPDIHNSLSKHVPSLNAMPAVTLYHIDKWQRMEESIRHYMNRYYEEGVSPVPLRLELGDDDLSFISSVHRALKHAR